MKPFFEPFFKPFFGAALPTRIGPRIGKSNERKMMDKAGGPDGIRKIYSQNPDGSTTMLKTRAGMPQFSPDPSRGSGGTVVEPPIITVSTEYATLEIPTSVTFEVLSHLVTISRTYGWAKNYSFSLVNETIPFYMQGISGIEVSGFSNGVSLDLVDGVITVPGGVSEFYVHVTVGFLYSAPPFDDPGTAHLFNYTVFVESAFGYGIY